jgi:hypothetical protein
MGAGFCYLFVVRILLGADVPNEFDDGFVIKKPGLS